MSDLNDSLKFHQVFQMMSRQYKVIEHSNFFFCFVFLAWRLINDYKKTDESLMIIIIFDSINLLIEIIISSAVGSGIQPLFKNLIKTFSF